MCRSHVGKRFLIIRTSEGFRTLTANVNVACTSARIQSCNGMPLLSWLTLYWPLRRTRSKCRLKTTFDWTSRNEWRFEFRLVYFSYINHIRTKGSNMPSMRVIVCATTDTCNTWPEDDLPFWFDPVCIPLSLHRCTWHQKWPSKVREPWHGNEMMSMTLNGFWPSLEFE